MNPFKESEISTILVVDSIDKSRSFYIDKLGATSFREYGGSSLVIQFLGHWMVLVTGGGPTPDKPMTTMSVPDGIESVSHSFTIRVKDCVASHRELVNRGVEFITPPIVNGIETRCFFPDPDGHLFEISSISAE